MKRLWIAVFLLCLSGQATAQSATADDNASCNASFHKNCAPDQSYTTSSTGFAAPIGVLGSTGLEGGLLALLIAGGIARRLHRHAAGGGWKCRRDGVLSQQEFRGRNDERTVVIED